MIVPVPKRYVVVPCAWTIAREGEAPSNWSVRHITKAEAEEHAHTQNILEDLIYGSRGDLPPLDL